MVNRTHKIMLSFNNAAGTMQIKLFIFGFKPLLVAGNGAGQIT